MSGVALITGGTRGIGAGVATALARSGFAIAVSGRRAEEEVRPFLDSIRAHNVDAMYVAADVADTTARAKLLHQVRQRFGALDILVNNAGIAPSVRADVLEETEENFDEVLKTNLRGPYFLTQQAARWMIEQQKAAPRFRAIINVSSISATVASVNRGCYCISKAGVGMATQLWAVRLAEYGIGVYEVRPGIIATDMTKGVQAKYDALIESGLLLEKRWGTPEDVGIAVNMLARGELPYATGAVLTLDGGLTMPRL
jgi:3-oxoacyl-[acyl-carrier protein] reductase